MAVATAILIAAGVSAATTAYAAKKAGKAAKLQSDAAEAARQDLGAERNRYSQRFEPYAQTASQAHQRLSDSLLLNAGRPIRTPMPQSPPQGGMPMPPQARLGGQGGGPMMAPNLQNSVQRATGQLWAVRAPDGSTRMVPPEMGQRVLAAGGTRVG